MPTAKYAQINDNLRKTASLERIKRQIPATTYRLHMMSSTKTWWQHDLQPRTKGHDAAPDLLNSQQPIVSPVTNCVGQSCCSPARIKALHTNPFAITNDCFKR